MNATKDYRLVPTGGYDTFGNRLYTNPAVPEDMNKCLFWQGRLVSVDIAERLRNEVLHAMAEDLYRFACDVEHRFRETWTPATYTLWKEAKDFVDRYEANRPAPDPSLINEPAQ